MRSAPPWERAVAANTLIWVGLSCCLIALAIQVFPSAAFQMGADVGASWRVFGFGVFLIAASVVLNLSGKNDSAER